MEREGTSENYRQLAAAILHQAVKDWNRFGALRTPTTKGAHDAFDLARAEKFHTPRTELLVFFRSWWFRFLCDALDLDPAVVARAAKVPLGPMWPH
jgi:hypothetical protein